MAAASERLEFKALFSLIVDAKPQKTAQTESITFICYAYVHKATNNLLKFLYDRFSVTI